MNRIAIAAVLLQLACSGESAVVAGGAGSASAQADVAAGSLGDGWQYQADAAPPNDSWVWSEDAKRWVGPDAGSFADATTTNPVDAATTAGLPDGAVAVGDGTYSLPDGAVVQPDGAPVVTDALAPADGVAPADSGSLPPPPPGSLGVSCAPPNSCEPGLTCFAAGTPQAYCGKVGCKTNGECASTSEDPLCCVKYGIQSYCTKQFGLATACGNQDKPVGADCKTGGQSDCDPGGGAFCLQTQSAAQCVAGCSANNQNCPAGAKCVVFENGNGGCIPFTPDKADATPCAGKTIGGCGAGAWCIEAYPGDPLAYCATLCKDDSACAKGFDCTNYGAGNGICQKHGTATAGQSCAGDRFACSKGLFCASQGTASAVCSPSCTSDAGCADYGKGLNQSAYCWKSPTGPWSVCLPKGDKQNGENCSKNPGSCSAGSWCIGGNDAYNPDAYCQKPCGDNSDGKCPTGSVCTKYGPNYSGCQPDGGKGHGESCAGAATSCKAGHFCIGPQGGEVCSKICKPTAAAGSADACPTGAWCSPWGNGETGSCIPSGAIAIGKPCKGSALSCAPQSFCQNWGQGNEAVCISPCGANKACPAGTDCKDYGQAGSYCQPAGGGKQGDACSNLDKPCAPGLACLSAGTPAAMCSKSCKADADCGDAKLYCASGNWGGWCVPDGTLGAYEVCYGKPWQCQKGLACIGNPSENPGAVCAKACSGFADVCGPGAKCQYYGNGQSWCQKTGKLPHGTICFQQQNDCDVGTLCVKGAPMPMCLQQCGFGYPACPTDSPCQFFAGSAVALCVPKDFKVGGPIFAPF